MAKGLLAALPALSAAVLEVAEVAREPHGSASIPRLFRGPLQPRAPALALAKHPLNSLARTFLSNRSARLSSAATGPLS